MSQGSFRDEHGKLIWQFDICCEFDCNIEFANKNGRDCKGDFTKKPCMFHGEHLEMNVNKWDLCEDDSFVDMSTIDTEGMDHNE